MKRHLSGVFALFLSVGLAGATSIFDFSNLQNFPNDGYSEPLRGYNGWSQSGDNTFGDNGDWFIDRPNPGDVYPLAYGVEFTRPNGGTTNGAGLGGGFDAPADPNLFYVENSLNLSLSSASYLIEAGFTESFFDPDFPTNPDLEDRNDFFIQFLDGATEILTLYFVDPGSYGFRNLAWSSNGGGLSSAFGAAQADEPYFINFGFEDNGADLDFSITFDPTDVAPASGTLPGLAGSTATTLRIGWSEDGVAGDGWGNNTFQFVPEPSAALLAGIAPLLLLRRRCR